MPLNIIDKRKIWYGCSAALIVLGFIFVSVFGLNFGIDFTGGTLISVHWEGERPSVQVLRNTLTDAGYPAAVVQQVGEQETVFKLATISEEEHRTLTATLADAHGELREDRFEVIGPTIGKELKKKSAWSIILIIGAVTAYVAIVFRKITKPVASWKYGVVTIAALAHDVFIPIAALALIGTLTGIELSSAIIVGLLTILGYSVNDTIVVLDRTRENLAKHGKEQSFETIVNTSINQTLIRSINTSLTTLLVLVPIVFFGGETLKYFALTLIIGVIAGTYSSIFLASPLLVTWHRWNERRAAS